MDTGLPRRLAATGLLLVVIAVGGGVSALQEHYRPTGQVEVSGELGQDISTPPFTVHIHGAHAVQTLLDRSGEPIQTPGLWVIVDLSYATESSVQTPGQLRIRDAHGRVFEDARWRAPSGLWLGHPGLWHRGSVAVEVPEDALGELEIEFRPMRAEVQAPVRYGTADVYVGPDEVQTDPAQLPEPELLDGGER